MESTRNSDEAFIWPLTRGLKCPPPLDGFHTFCNHHTEAEAPTGHLPLWLWTHFCFRGMWEDEMFAALLVRAFIKVTVQSLSIAKNCL